MSPGAKACKSPGAGLRRGFYRPGWGAAEKRF